MTGGDVVSAVTCDGCVLFFARRSSICNRGLSGRFRIDDSVEVCVLADLEQVRPLPI